MLQDDGNRVARVAEITDMAEPRTIVHVSEREKVLLLRWSRSRLLAARIVLRSRIILMLAEHGRVALVAGALGVAPATVRLWRNRFLEHGSRALLQEASGRGRKPALDAAIRQALRAAVAAGDAPSVRRQAAELGVSAATVSRWRRRGD
jgi:transposase